MSFQWLRRGLGVDQAAERLVSLIGDLTSLTTTANESASQHTQEQKKGLRRLSLAQKQQSEAVDGLSSQLSHLMSAMECKDGITLNFEQVVDIFDHLSRVQVAAQNSDILSPLADQAVATVLQHTDIMPIATLGEAYPNEHCEVVGAIPDAHLAPGAVQEIIQQGYRTLSGSLIRVAKVVVSQQIDIEETSV